MDTKICSKCGEEKSICDYPKDRTKTEEDLYKLCHYTNLQPLWAEENLKKSNKILVEPLNK